MIEAAEGGIQEVRPQVMPEPTRFQQREIEQK
jgi:hypothetical protein